MKAVRWENPKARAEDPRPHLLFLAHCVPNPPDKGEKIRAFHEIRFLAHRYRIHLVCFGRSDRELDQALELADVCASIYAERFYPGPALALAAVRFAAGDCLNRAYYDSRAMKRHVEELARRVTFTASLAYSVVMVPYAPAGVPVVLDMIDVDSEKWFHYGRARRPGFLYTLEAGRLREFERRSTAAAKWTLLVTQNEESVLRSFASGRTGYFENGADTAHFDGLPHPAPPDLAGARFLVFIGAMDYFPNIDAASWFASEIFPSLRRRDPALRFVIAGKGAGKDVQSLARIDGVTVTGAVPDVRPYISNARAIVVPLRLARGIQNKVLDGLAMGRQVFASTQVCKTFGSSLPEGIVQCHSPAEWVDRVVEACALEPSFDPRIRQSVIERFTWATNLQVLERAISSA